MIDCLMANLKRYSFKNKIYTFILKASEEAPRKFSISSVYMYLFYLVMWKYGFNNSIELSMIMEWVLLESLNYLSFIKCSLTSYITMLFYRVRSSGKLFDRYMHVNLINGGAGPMNVGLIVRSSPPIKAPNSIVSKVGL